MALIKSSLESALVVALSASPASSIAAAKGMADAYATYAGAAMAGVTLPVFTGLEKNALMSQLIAAIAVPLVGSPATLATAWSSGVSAFWLTPPVVFVGPGLAGTVSGFTGQSALQSSLQTAFLMLTNSISQTAALMASALDVATKTVQATIAPPPGTIVMLL